MSSARTEIYLTLGILGDFDPADVSQRLDIEATRSYLEGAVVGTGHSGRVQGQSGWQLDTDPALGDFIEPHLDWLLSTFEPKAVELASLRAEGASIRVDCFWSSIGSGGGPWIGADAMRRLAVLDLDLIVSFYASD